MKPIEFSAHLPASLRQELEALFFFNPRQPESREGIVATVEELGAPIVVESGDRIWIGVPSVGTQCLFACETQDGVQRPVGVVLYGRPQPDVIWIFHLAVDPGRVCGRLGAGVGWLLVEKVREIAGRMKGVARIRLPYRKDRFLPVRSRPSPAG